ncbi:MAG: hypothetical protein V4805_08310 [Pseudomonadota bacterium]
MKQAIFLVIAGLTALCAMPALSAAPTAPRYSDDEGVFSVAFKATPTVKADSLRGASGNSYKRKLYVVETPRSMTSVGVTFLSSDRPNTPEEQSALLATAVQDVTNGMPGFVLDPKNGVTNIQRGSHPGKLLRGAINSQLSVTIALFETPFHALMVQGLYPTSNSQAAKEVIDFVNSFDIVEN